MLLLLLLTSGDCEDIYKEVKPYWPTGVKRSRTPTEHEIYKKQKKQF